MPRRVAAGFESEHRRLSGPNRRVILSAAIGAIASAGIASGQLSVTTNGSPFAITFDSTIAGVSNGAFAGAGFQAAPASGQLDSDAFAITGWSEGSLLFGGTQTTGDFARGSVAVGVTTGGIYAQTGTATGTAMMFQPGSNDWAPGTMTLKLQNNTGAAVNGLTFSYIVYVRNDQARGNTFNFSASSDDANYYGVSSLDLISTEVVDGLVTAQTRTTTITGLALANGSSYFLRWSSGDVNGSGSRDEFAIDNIAVTANSSLTWDSDTGTGGTQDAGGTWVNGSTNFFDGTSNVAYSNATPSDVVFGSGSGSGASAITIDAAGVAARGVTFAASSPNYTLSGGTLSISEGMAANNDGTISSPVTLAGATNWNVATGQTLNLNGVASGTGSLDKVGGGTLVLNSVLTFTGATYVDGGVVNVAVAGALANTRGIVVGNSGTLLLTGTGDLPDSAIVTLNSNPGNPASAALDINGKDETIGGLTMTGGRVFTGAGTLRLGGNGNITMFPSLSATGSSVINGNLDLGSGSHIAAIFVGTPTPDIDVPANVSGSGTFIKDATGSMYMGADNAFTGTVQINAGNLRLRGANGRLANAGTIVINSHGTLTLDNTLSGDNANRVNDSTPILSNGGTIDFRTQATGGSSESLGVLTLGSGGTNVRVVPAATSGTGAVTFAGLNSTRPVGSSVNFQASTGNLGDLAAAAPTQVLINSGVTSGQYIGGFATYTGTAGTDFAVYDATRGVIGATDGVATDTPNANIKVTTTGLTTFATAPLKTFNSLNISPSGANTSSLVFGTSTVLLSTGGIIKGSGTAGATLSFSRIQSATNELNIFVNTGSLLFVGSTLDNGAVPLSVTKSGAGTFFGTSSQLHTGTTTVNLGVFLISTGTGLQNTGTVVINRGTLQENNANLINDAAYVFMNGGGVNTSLLTMAGGETIGTLTMQGGAQISGSLGSLGFSGNAQIIRDAAAGPQAAAINCTTLSIGSVDRTFVINNHPIAAVDMSITSNVIGTGTLIKQGSGVLALSSNANAWSGGTQINAGTLQAGNNNAVPASAGVSVNNAAFDLNSYNNAIGTLALTSGSVVGTGTLTPGGTVSTNGVSSISANVALSADRAFLTGVSSVLTISGRVAGGSGFAKQGAGTLRLTNANTYSGTTTVSNGVLLASNTTGSATGTGAVNVDATGTLGGNGFITGAVNINASGTLAPGESIGDLDTGTLTFADGTSKYLIEIDADAELADRTNVTGGVTLNGATLQLSFTAISVGVHTTPQTYVIVNNDAGDSVGGIFAASISAPPWASVMVNYAFSGLDDAGFLADGNDVAITVTYTPEPTTLGLALLSNMFLARRRRA